MTRFFKKFLSFFFFNDTATTEIYTLSLHDALPISRRVPLRLERARHREPGGAAREAGACCRGGRRGGWRAVPAPLEGRRPDARLRLLRVVGSQDARAAGLGSARRQAGAARGDAALSRRRRDGLAPLRPPPRRGGEKGGSRW